MDPIREWAATEVEELRSLEQVFLKRVKDDDIRSAYLAARKGDPASFRALMTIAAEGPCDDQASPRQVQADIAVDIVRWFRMATFDESLPAQGRELYSVSRHPNARP